MKLIMDKTIKSLSFGMKSRKRKMKKKKKIAIIQRYYTKKKTFKGFYVN